MALRCEVLLPGAEHASITLESFSGFKRKAGRQLAMFWTIILPSLNNWLVEKSILEHNL
jgi:hypothetical protein